MASILITGGAGFIGCRLGERLVAQGHDVAALDSLHPQVHASRGRPVRLSHEVTLLTGDVTSDATWGAALKLVSPDVVVHLAAETGTGQSLTEATRHGSVNVVGTTQMLDSLLRAGAVPDHLVLASSRAVYGEGRWIDDAGVEFYPGCRTHEALVNGQWDPPSPTGRPARPLPHRASTTHPRPANVYAATKLAQEHVMGAWAVAMGAKLSVLRLQNVYGPGQSLANTYTGVVTHFAAQALRGETIDVYEDGNILRDFVYVDDVVVAFASAVASPPATTRTLDVGSGAGATIADAAAFLASAAGAPAPLISGKFRDGDVRAASCTIEDTEADLGYKPAMALEDGLRELLRWVEAGADG